MELLLTEEQVFFLETTSRFLSAEASIPTVRALEQDPNGFSDGYWRQACELGWTSMLVSEAHGGGSLTDLGLSDLALVVEEVGRRVAPGPIVPVNLVASSLSATAGATLREQHLPGLLDGTTVGAWTGPDAVEGRVEGTTIVLDGTAEVVEAAAQAAILLVVAEIDGRASQVIVDSTSPGVTITPLGSLDLVRRFARVELRDVRVDSAAVVGTVGDAAEEVARLERIAAALGCAEASGATERCFEMTVEYLGDRFSFGRPLSSYQALKHRLADDKVWIEACHATTSGALRAIATSATDAAELVGAAKWWVGTHSTEIIQDCVQLHGGIGVTWEHDLHLYLRRATVNRMTYGTPDEWADRIATILLEDAS